MGGATLIEDANTLEDSLEVSQGVRLDRSGYISAYFVTDLERRVRASMVYLHPAKGSVLF